MATTTTATIVEHCQIPPSAPTEELLLPLVFSDVVFFPLPLREYLAFYSFSTSESHFSDTVVPNLKNSLSLTLNHFSPLAGKIIFPLTSSGTPVSHYVAGDAISLTIAVSKADLIPLTGNLSRDSDQFHDFIPDLPPATYSTDFIKFSVAAIQVTLFPNQGICIGITHHHAIADGSTFVRFLHAWASMTKFDGDSHLLAASSTDSQKCLSFYDRSRLEEEGDIKTLTRACWDLARTRGPPTISSKNYLPVRKKRATFVLSGPEIQNLKNFVVNKKPSVMANVSSFVVLCAHVWTSLAKSAGRGAAADDDELENVHCAADCRRRLSPPMPENYFGNCLALVMAESTRGKLKGDQGIVIAAEAISEGIRETVNNENGILDGYMERVLRLRSVRQSGNRMLGIAGSPRFDVYGADFGWGRPIKFEFLHTDYGGGSVSLCKSREFEGGVEIGLSMTEAKIDAFAAIFNQGLKEATQVII